MEHVLVTGGLGFIGSRIVQQLVLKGYRVTVIDKNTDTSRLQDTLSNHPDCLRLVRGDITQPAAIEAAMQGAEAVIHEAAIIGVEYSLKHPQETAATNVQGTVNLLEYAAKHGVVRFLNISSAAIYGSKYPPPLREELTPAPESPYAASKAAAELFCKSYQVAQGLDVVSLRYFNVYGPGMKGGPYAAVIERFGSQLVRGEPLTIYGDGKQTRDFIHVRDVADATLRALEAPDIGGETINIGTGKETRILDVARLMARIAGCEPELVMEPPRPGDVRFSYASVDKARELLGWEAKIGLEEGLKNYLESLKGQEESSAGP